MGGEAKLSPKQRELLDQVAAENVTWRNSSFRLWHGEHDYEIVTRQIKQLLAAGLVATEMAAGFTYVRRGPVVLTAPGRSAQQGESE